MSYETQDFVDYVAQSYPEAEVVAKSKGVMLHTESGDYRLKCVRSTRKQNEYKRMECARIPHTGEGRFMQCTNTPQEVSRVTLKDMQDQRTYPSLTWNELEQQIAELENSV